MIIIHNPDSTFYGKRLSDILTFKRGYKKYKYIIKYIIKNNVKFKIYNDSGDKYYILLFKYFIWSLFNGFNPFIICKNIINDVKKISKNDIFLGFIDGYLNNEKNIIKLKYIKKDILKVFHCTHYVHKTSEINKGLNDVGIDFLIAENNLYKNSKYFINKMNNYKKDLYSLPFVFDNRFEKKKNFIKRKNKCLATGTFYNIEKGLNLHVLEDFVSFFNENTLHPIRKKIYDNKEKYTKYIDSLINDFNSERPKNSYSKNFFHRIKNYIYNRYFANRQRKYFSFNIVKKYNEYKMFISPEELVGLPGIGFIEGMACGSAYIGKIDKMYTSIGIFPGIHYIGYDGTTNNLIEKIKYYQSKQDELEKIANNGYNYVKNNFNGNIVGENFINDLNKLQKKYKKNGYSKKNLEFKCSFTNNV